MNSPKGTGVLRAILVLALVVLGAAACSSSPTLTASQQSKLDKLVLHLYAWPNTKYGTVVGGIDGILVYADKDESGGKIECTGSCTKTWIPWTTNGSKVVAEPGVNQQLIGSVPRTGGKVQMTYGGHPLYFHRHSGHSLTANGQGAQGKWYVVDTNGRLVT